MILLKKDVYNAQIKNIEDKLPNITNLATNTTLTAVENKIPNFGNLYRWNGYNTKLVKLRIKLLLIMIMINILRPKNLIKYQQEMLLQD